MRKFTFRGGVHPYEGKELTAEKPVRVMEAGVELAFLLSQHIGAPAKSIVKKGDQVLAGQMIAEAGGACIFLCIGNREGDREEKDCFRQPC